MTDVFIQQVQLNTTAIKANITSEGLNTSNVIFDQSIPYRTKAVNYHIAAQAQRYKFSFSLINTVSGTFTDLVNKTKDIYNTIINTQLNDKKPILISTNDTEVYLIYKKVYVIIDNFTYSMKGEDGGRFIDLEIEGIIHGVPVSDGGNISDIDPWQLGGPLGVTEYEVGFIEVGYS